MVQVLCRRRKNNPLLVGEPGVGKTALAEGLALRIHQGDVPEALQDRAASSRSTWARSSPARAIAATSKSASSRCSTRSTSRTHAILFIDEIHTLVGAGSASGGTMDAGNLLKPALASGKLRCIGSTTFSDVKQSFDKDRALSRRFQKIEVLEPTEAETIEILKGLKGAYETHHGVTYPDETLEAAVTLSARHLKDLHQPDKAIDVIDEAGAAKKLRDRRIGGSGDPRDATVVTSRPSPTSRGSSRRSRACRCRRCRATTRWRCKQSRCRAEVGDLRAGRGDRRGRLGDQAVALGPARRRQADGQLPVRRARPASARRSWRGSWRAC